MKKQYLLTLAIFALATQSMVGMDQDTLFLQFAATAQAFWNELKAKEAFQLQKNTQIPPLHLPDMYQPSHELTLSLDELFPHVDSYVTPAEHYETAAKNEDTFAFNGNDSDEELIPSFDNAGLLQVIAQPRKISIDEKSIKIKKKKVRRKARGKRYY